jgi:hypothetical protein
VSEPPDPSDPAGPDPARPAEPLVELGPPVSEVPWSPEFAQQSLEVLILTRAGDEARWLKPAHGDSLLVGVPAVASPGDVVLETLRWYELVPRVVHSTSWRHDGGRLVLTYLAVVEPPPALPPADVIRAVPVVRSDLARGEATAPPKEIGVLQVIEHALRHLSWLLHDDPAIAEALPDWRPILDRYQPEPFRALG